MEMKREDRLCARFDESREGTLSMSSHSRYIIFLSRDEGRNHEFISFLLENWFLSIGQSEEIVRDSVAHSWIGIVEKRRDLLGIILHIWLLGLYSFIGQSTNACHSYFPVIILLMRMGTVIDSPRETM
ncbi:hypothetical protein PENTCL1PPCAC_17272, partial [Pristionchus entomophagus]